MEKSIGITLKNRVLQRVKEEGNMLHTVNQRKADWSHRALELNYETRNWRKDRREDRSDGKTRKKA